MPPTTQEDSTVETADPFAQQGDIIVEDAPVADPFATGDEQTATPDASPDLPVVNREGEPVAAPVFDPVTQTLQKPADQDAPIEAQDVPAAADDAPAAPEAPEAAVDAPEAPQEAQEPETATDGGEQPPQEPPVAPPTPAEPTGAAGGEETATTGPRGGKGEMRFYKLLYLTGESQWTEHKLDPQHPEHGEYIALIDGEPWMKARNNDHAKRIGYTLLGRPKDGVRLFPVPKGAWKPSTVKPAPPKPERESLVIE